MTQLNAIRFDDKDQVDDVAISGDLIRLERLDKSSWWVAVYRGSQRTTFHVYRDGDEVKIKVCENDLNAHDDTKEKP